MSTRRHQDDEAAATPAGCWRSPRGKLLSRQDRIRIRLPGDRRVGRGNEIGSSDRFRNPHGKVGLMNSNPTEHKVAPGTSRTLWTKVPHAIPGRAYGRRAIELRHSTRIPPGVPTTVRGVLPDERRVTLSSLRVKLLRQQGSICKYCGCTLAGVSEVKVGSGVYDRPC